jgi:molybdopterin synthase catalytic subunit
MITVKVTYTAQGSPDTVMTFDLTSIDIESIKKELPLKKKELDSKFNVDPHKSSIIMAAELSKKYENIIDNSRV